MLPHNRRVSTALFDEIMKSGTTYHSDHISLRIHRITAQNLSRFSVVVSKKVENKAVSRNVLKRRLYSVLSMSLSSIPPGYAGILFIKKGFSSLSVDYIKKELAIIIEKSFKIPLL
ncbi:MAG: ribonuclease P protein component [bacterium]|nr:ribonuclease P protein component [bacterium]